MTEQAVIITDDPKHEAYYRLEPGFSRDDLIMLLASGKAEKRYSRLMEGGTVLEVFIPSFPGSQCGKVVATLEGGKYL